MARVNQLMAVVSVVCRGGLRAVCECLNFRFAHDIVRIVAACIVLAAAGLKAHQLMTETVHGTGLLESRWFLIGVVGFELFVALWLLSTFLRSPGWRAAGGDRLSTAGDNLLSSSVSCAGGSHSWTWRASMAAASLIAVCLAFWTFLARDSSQEKSLRQRSSAGGLVCEEAVWNFGVIDSFVTPTVSHDFTLTNESHEVVHIEKIIPTCSCMVSNECKRVLSPGESTQLEMSVRLPPAPGPLQKLLVIEVRGSERPLPLYVTGRVSANATLYSLPPQINFGRIAAAQTRDRTFRLLRYDGSPVKVLRIIGSVPSLQCSLEPQSDDTDGIATIRVRLNSDQIPKGDYSATVTVVTAHEKYREIRVLASACVTDALGVTKGPQ